MAGFVGSEEIYISLESKSEEVNCACVYRYVVIVIMIACIAMMPVDWLPLKWWSLLFSMFYFVALLFGKCVPCTPRVPEEPCGTLVDGLTYTVEHSG